MKVQLSKTLLALSVAVYLVGCTSIDKPADVDSPPSAAIPAQLPNFEVSPKDVAAADVILPDVLPDVVPDVVSDTGTEGAKKLVETSPGVEETSTKEEIAQTPIVDSKTMTKSVAELVPTPNPVISLCNEIGSKLGSVSINECLNQQLIHSSYSAENRSLAFKDFPPLSGRAPLGRVLVIGGIHGDEFSSVSMLFRWMGKLDQFHSGMFHWRFVPSSNPDGLLKRKSQRQNVNGVDLNRNFPTADWENLALSFWVKESLRNPRRYPGPNSASEPETQWLVNQIDVFKPDVIISMHAPYHLVDYDGPPKAPDNLGSLYLKKLGVFPGSLGNYAGVDLNMPIVTVELQSAGIMPSTGEIDQMWRDLIGWLRGQLSTSQSD